jgi:hypothetical protein
MALAMAFCIKAFARGLRGAPEARNRDFVIGRLHQLVGDEHLPATDIPLRRDLGALIELAKPRCRGQIIGAEITGGDQLPVLQLHADGLLQRSVLEDAGGGIVVPHLVVVPRQDAGQGYCEKRPHLAQRRPHRLVDLKQIEADCVPVGGHLRFRVKHRGGPTI